MRIEECQVGQHVVYLDGSRRPEYGVITEVRERGVIVLYAGGLTGKYTYPADLSYAKRPEGLTNSLTNW